MLAGKETHLEEVSLKIMTMQMFSFLASSKKKKKKKPSKVCFYHSLIHSLTGYEMLISR